MSKGGRTSMRTASRLTSPHDLIIYPAFISIENKKLLRLSAIALVFVLTSCRIIVSGNRSDAWKGWLGVMAFGPCLLMFLLQFTWSPLLVVHEQGICVRSNPLLASIKGSDACICSHAFPKGCHPTRCTPCSPLSSRAIVSPSSNTRSSSRSPGRDAERTLYGRPTNSRTRSKATIVAKQEKQGNQGDKGQQSGQVDQAIKPPALRKDAS